MKRPAQTTVNVSLPRPLRTQLEQKVHRLGSYGSMSEYVRELIRRDLQRDAIAKVDALLLEGLNSGEPVPIDAQWWKDRHVELERHRQSRAKKQRKRA